MKIWYWLLGIIILIISVLVYILKEPNVQLKISKYYEGKNDYDSAAKWNLLAYENGNKSAKEFFEGIEFNDNDIGHEYYLDILRLLRDDEYWTAGNENLIPETIDKDDFHIVGLMYFDGYGVKQDKALGYAWFRGIHEFKESRFNKTFALKIIACAKSKMSEDEILKSQEYLPEILSEIELRYKNKRLIALMAVLLKEISIYEAKNGKYPETQELGDSNVASNNSTKYGSEKLFADFSIKTSVFDIGLNWTKGKTKKEFYIDPWGNEILYVTHDHYDTATYQGKPIAVKTASGNYHNPSTFQLRSFGPNGVDDGGVGDDVGNWE